MRQAGREPHDLVGVAVNQRQRREARLVDDKPEVGVGRVHRGDLGGDADGFLQRADLQDDGQVARFGHLQDDVLLHVRLEAGQFDGDLVGARQEEVRLEEPLLVGGDGDRGIPGRFRNGHGRPGNRPFRGVRHPPGDAAARLLRADGRRKARTVNARTTARNTYLAG